MQSRSTLKTKTNFRASYAAKVAAGEKKQYRYKPKATNRSQYYSILTQDLHRCYISNDVNNIHIHHIFGGSNKANSEKYGFLVPLRADWHDMADYGVHFDRSLDYKLKKLCQDYWLGHYGSREEFVAAFGKWWVD